MADEQHQDDQGRSAATDGGSEYMPPEAALLLQWTMLDLSSHLPPELAEEVRELEQETDALLVERYADVAAEGGK